jgi:hypothetical protein
VEWIKCLQECVEKAASNERIAQMANLQEVILEFRCFTDCHAPECHIFTLPADQKD